MPQYKKILGLANRGTSAKAITATAVTQVLVTEGSAEIDITVATGIAAIATLPAPSVNDPDADIVPGQFVRVNFSSDAVDAANGVETLFTLTPAGLSAITFQDAGDSVLFMATDTSYIILEDSRRSITSNQPGTVVANNTSANLDLTGNNYANGGSYTIFLTGALGAEVRLPQATIANTGMHIRVVCVVATATDGSAKFILENAGSTVINGACTLNSTGAGNKVASRAFADAKSIELDADANDHAGGAEGSVYDFHYVGANSIFLAAKGLTGGTAPALDANVQTTTGF